MIYATGLLPSPEPPALQLASYIVPELLPPIPATFGHKDAYPPRGWGLLKNGGRGALGDCSVAGAMHATMLWRKVVGRPVRFTDLDASEDYFAITGGKDKGVSVSQLMDYWRKTGFRDSRAERHKILAYLAVDHENVDHIDAACALFDAVGLGITIGPNEMAAFSYQQPWDNPNTKTKFYHYVPYIHKDEQYRYCVTWGGLQPFGEPWMRAKVKEVVVALSDENLIAGKSPEGFDLETLVADLELIGVKNADETQSV